MGMRPHALLYWGCPVPADLKFPEWLTEAMDFERVPDAIAGRVPRAPARLDVVRTGTSSFVFAAAESVCRVAGYNADVRVEPDTNAATWDWALNEFIDDLAKLMTDRSTLPLPRNFGWHLTTWFY